MPFCRSETTTRDRKIAMNKVLCLLATFFLLSAPSFCQVTLPRLVSDGMILQRDTKTHVWGWASPDESVELTFRDSTYRTQADAEGSWAITLPAQAAGGPYEIQLSASNQITLRDILFGDVWVCSGQSNMELPMERVKEKYRQVVAEAENPQIRQFLVPDRYDFQQPQPDVESGTWQSVTHENILQFSAVAYFFASDLYEAYQVPIGLINTALGGSPVESWISEEALKKFPEAYDELQRFKSDALIDSIERSDQQRADSWYGELEQKDEGLKANPDWKSPEAADQDWKTTELPSYWADGPLGEVNGVVWFRKELDVPASMAGKPASLWLGRIVDQDFAYLNGELVGTTGYQYPPRRYTVESGILKEGKNALAVRVVNNAGRGGFVPDKPYYLAVGKDTIDLTGTWKYKLGATMPPLAGPTFIRWKPGGLYNAMIAPLLNYPIKGALWYQGESNTAHPSQYSEALSTMIADWRQRWGQGDFPFLLVQLANFMEATSEPVESNWAELRQAQLETLSVPNTGMAVIIDVGEWNDIHPLNKQAVGHRLALQAKKLAYGEDEITAAGPIPTKANFKPSEVLISFDNVGGGLVAQGGDSLTYFALSGDGEHFVWANAEVKGDTVRVWSEQVSNPTVVRYAWSDNPETANLYNEAGLPATPFELSK